MEIEDLKILIVDDSMINRKYVVKKLEEYGLIRCVESSDGSDAIQQMKKQHFDVVIMDINMPGLNGNETISLIREYFHKINQTEPLFVTLTSNAFRDELDKATDAGTHLYIRKPFLDSHVHQILKKVMG